MRWHARHQTEGTGHLYQGRFKAFPIEEDDHLLTLLRYVERYVRIDVIVPRTGDGEAYGGASTRTKASSRLARRSSETVGVASEQTAVRARA